MDCDGTLPFRRQLFADSYRAEQSLPAKAKLELQLLFQLEIHYVV